MTGLMYQLIMRRGQRRPWQLLLGVLGVALGVAIVLAIDLTNASALKGFEISSQSIVNGYSHQIQGGPAGLDESLYRRLRTGLGLHRLLPLVEGVVSVGDDNHYQLMGMDPIALLGTDVPGASGRDGGALLRLIAEPDTVYIADSVARHLQLQVPGTITVYAGERQRVLNVIGIMPAHGQVQGQLLQSGLLTDIATAQELLGMQGRLSRIDITLNNDEVKRVRALLAPGQRLETAETPLRVMAQMTRAFRINLTALSLLALVIGAFLIYNTMTLSVLQRREQFAVLRILGTAHGDIFLLVICESLALAALGILAGYGLGIGLSHVLIRFAARTLEDLYFVTEVQHIYLNGWSFIKATALGLAGVLAAACLPARDAMNTVPVLTHSRSFLEQRARSDQGRLLLYSCCCGVIAVIILLSSGRSISGGFASLFFIIISFALLSPLLLVVLVSMLRPLLEGLAGLTGGIATRGVLASLSRTRVAVTALAVAISATIGVSIMIGSFRHSVETWLRNYLRADVYITTIARSGDYTMGTRLLKQLRAIPGVEKLTTTSYQNVWQNGNPVRLRVVDIDRQVFASYPLKHKDIARSWALFNHGDGVLVSEPFAYHHRLREGDEITLDGDAGARQFRVAGIYVDYGSDQGVITMDRNIYHKYWREARVTSAALYSASSVDVEALARSLNDGPLQATEFRARANRVIREQSMRIFDRTFSITQVLRVLTVIIAVIGIFGALMSIQLERNREFAVLRATGLTAAGLRQLILTEGGLMGLAAGIIAMPLGIMLAAVLIYVINRRSFGWTMDFLLEPRYLAGALVLGLGAGILAGVYPAWRLGRTPPAAALRDE